MRLSPPSSEPETSDVNGGESVSNPATRNQGHRRQTYLMRKILRIRSNSSSHVSDAEANSNGTKPQHSNIRSSSSPSSMTSQNCQVSVLIRLPSPQSAHARRMSSAARSSGSMTSEKEKEKEHGIHEEFMENGADAEFNYSLGIADVPVLLSDGNEKSQNKG